MDDPGRAIDGILALVAQPHQLDVSVELHPGAGGDRGILLPRPAARVDDDGPGSRELAHAGSVRVPVDEARGMRVTQLRQQLLYLLVVLLDERVAQRGLAHPLRVQHPAEEVDHVVVAKALIDQLGDPGPH